MHAIDCGALALVVFPAGLRNTLVVWGALEAALVFALPVRLLSSSTVPKGRRKEAIILHIALYFC